MVVWWRDWFWFDGLLVCLFFGVVRFVLSGGVGCSLFVCYLLGQAVLYVGFA